MLFSCSKCGFLRLNLTWLQFCFCCSHRILSKWSKRRRPQPRAKHKQLSSANEIAIDNDNLMFYWKTIYREFLPAPNLPLRFASSSFFFKWIFVICPFYRPSNETFGLYQTQWVFVLPSTELALFFFQNL